MYTWAVQYLDGRLVTQYDENGEEKLWGSLPKDDMDVVMWRNTEGSNVVGIVVGTGEFYVNGVRIYPRAGKKGRKFTPQVYFRNQVVVSYGAEISVEDHKKISHVIGWETTLGKQHHKLFCVIEPDDTIKWERYIDGVVKEARLVI